jgi:hypothetical protein
LVNKWCVVMLRMMITGLSHRLSIKISHRKNVVNSIEAPSKVKGNDRLHSAYSKPR